MSRTFKINLILLCIVMLLAAVAWYSNIIDKQSPIVLLTKLQPEQVSKISIQNRNTAGFVLERRDNTWNMVSPYQAPANTQRIQHLLEITRSRSISRFKVPESIGEYGLASPLAKLHLNKSEILIGGTHPMNKRRYLQHKGQVHLINDRFIHHLQAKAEEFIDHRLLPNVPNIQAIQTPDWSISQSTDGQTTLSPTDKNISQDSINKKLDSWKTAVASSVVPVTEEKGFSTLEVSFQEQHPIKFEIEKRENKIRLIRRDLGISYILPAATKLLDPPVKEN